MPFPPSCFSRQTVHMSRTVVPTAVLVSLFLLAAGTVRGQVSLSPGKALVTEPLHPALGAADKTEQSSDSLSVVTAGSFSPGGVAPGAIVSLFGPNIGPAASAGTFLTQDGTLTRNLAGAEVRFGDEAAPLLFVSAGQINAQVPFSVAGSETVPVSVYLNGRLTGQTVVEVKPTNLDLFFFDPLSRHVAILNQDGSLNSPRNPARPGQILTLFGSGHGQTNPPAQTGALASPPLASLANPLKVSFSSGTRIGDLDILYAGPAPGFAGLFQANLRLPVGLRNVYGALHIFVESPSTNDSTYGIVAVSSFEDEDEISSADYYVASGNLSPAHVAPGGVIDFSFRVANMGAEARRSFNAWVDFEQNGQIVPGALCRFSTGLGSRASSQCSGQLTVPTSLANGAYRLRIWANPFTRANRSWAPELNTNNNSLFVGGSISGLPSGGDVWSGVLQFQGQMTLSGRTAPATIDIIDGSLAGQVLGLDSSNLLSFFFTNNTAPTIDGNTISYQIRSDSLLLGNNIYSAGTGTFSLTMERRELGAPVTGEVTLTYQGGNRFTGRFSGTVVQADQ